MPTLTAPLSFCRQASLFTRLVVGCLILVTVLTGAHGANTFIATGSLSAVRSTHTASLLPDGRVILTGTTLLSTRDSDSDGLSDAAEFQLASLGFDFNLSQLALVNAMYSNLNVAPPNLNSTGLHTAAQMQALNVGTPLFQRNATTGQFKLTLGLEKSANLTAFTPFPFLAPQTSVNDQGKIEFLFTVPDNAAFFRLRPQ